MSRFDAPRSVAEVESVPRTWGTPGVGADVGGMVAALGAGVDGDVAVVNPAKQRGGTSALRVRQQSSILLTVVAMGVSSECARAACRQAGLLQRHTGLCNTDLHTARLTHVFRTLHAWQQT